ncbi:hypothetical protein E4U34_006338 [Claviceps purpurea]|nr:hypothetical protein E4U34_006338 [Claviceps purpurea]
MDPQHWHRTINPIAHGLNRFHSEARRIGVCDSADVDRVIEEDLRALAIELVFCLRIYASEVIRGSVLDDVVTVFRAVVKDDIGDAAVRRLLKAAITKADEKTLWDEVLTLAATLTAAHTATKPSAPRSTEPQDKGAAAAQISTPRINVSEHQSLPVATVAPGCTMLNQSQSPSQYTTDYASSSSEHDDDSGTDSRRSPRLDRWNYMDDLDLAAEKSVLLSSASEFKEEAERDFMPYYKPLLPYVNQLRQMLPYVVQLPGRIFKNSIPIKGPGPELYSQMINVLRQAQEDPEVLAE